MIILAEHNGNVLYRCDCGYITNYELCAQCGTKLKELYFKMKYNNKKEIYMTKQEIMQMVKKPKSKVLEFLLTIPEAGKVKYLEECQLVLTDIFIGEMKYNLHPAKSKNIKERFKVIEKILIAYGCNQDKIDYGINALAQIAIYGYEKKAIKDKLINKYNPVNDGINVGNEIAKLQKANAGKSDSIFEVSELDSVIDPLSYARAFWR